MGDIVQKISNISTRFVVVVINIYYIVLFYILVDHMNLPIYS